MQRNFHEFSSIIKIFMSNPLNRPLSLKNRWKRKIIDFSKFFDFLWTDFRFWKWKHHYKRGGHTMQRKCDIFSFIFVILRPGWPDLAKNVKNHEFSIFQETMDFYDFLSDFYDAKRQDHQKHMGNHNPPQILRVFCDLCRHLDPTWGPLKGAYGGAIAMA